MNRKSRIIINIDESFPYEDYVAVQRVVDVMKEGKISKAKDNKQYCYLTVYYDDIVVSALPKYKTKADSFWVYKQKSKST